MNAKSVALLCALAVAVLALLSGPVSAVILESTYTGKVTGMNTNAGTMTIEANARYGIDYTPAGAVPSWNPITPVSLTGTVPDKAAYSLINVGDTVRAVQLGSSDGPFITVAKVSPNEKTPLVMNIVGEPREGIADLLKGNYTVSYTTKPDCARYNVSMGTVVPAASASVVISRDGKTLLTKTLKPGKNTVYKDKTGNGVTVRFVKGQASSQDCRGAGSMMTGPQPVSVFVITPLSPSR